MSDSGIPDLDDPRFLLALARWLRNEAQAGRHREWTVTETLPMDRFTVDTIYATEMGSVSVQLVSVPYSTSGGDPKPRWGLQLLDEEGRWSNRSGPEDSGTRTAPARWRLRCRISPLWWPLVSSRAGGPPARR